MNGDGESCERRRRQHGRRKRRRDRVEPRDRLPEQRHRDHDRGCAVEVGAQAPADGRAAIGRAEPQRRIAERDRDAHRGRPHRRFRQRAQQIGAAEHDERAADEGERRDEIESACRVGDDRGEIEGVAEIDARVLCGRLECRDARLERAQRALEILDACIRRARLAVHDRADRADGP
jgi:hypothetical protein